MLVILLVLIAVLALLGGVHWYVWRRLVRDVTVRGSLARRLGTAAAFLLPLLSVAALVSARAGAPFRLQQAVAWPGFLWLALLLYLTLALVAGEAVRPLLRRQLDRRAASAGAVRPAGADSPPASADGARPAAPEPGRPTGPAGTPRPAPSRGAASGAAAPAEAGGTLLTGLSDAPSADPRVLGADRSTDAGTAEETVRAAGSGSDAPDSAPDGAPENPGDAGRSGGPTVAGADDGSAAGASAAAGPAGPGAVSRRLFVSRVVGGTAAAVAAGTVGYGTYGVFRGPRVKRVVVPLARLPRAAHGYRIAVVSDIHLGPILGRAHTERIVDSINAAQPDLVAVVGDLVDGTVENLGRAAEPLSRLTARHGSFFVTGNHEYFSGADAWVDHVRELGLRPLRNERVEIAAGFDLAGVDDVAGESEGQGPDFGRALGDRDRARAAVLLAHQPVVIHDAVRHGVDLQLSGHTHGGQLWPGNYLADLANPTVAGLERYGDTQLYVSRGAGAWGPPVRVGAPSDITLVQLASKRA
ncbi:metallophosphoesterase [Streptomyces sp. NPDC048577]|uniref:metallophosphoesterase n=1 Tax=Streptomyces sp. NPDC048577 TaxID=3157209 RepID=UPI00341EF8B9